jgi:formate/nitrite transporter FocA (FNT family)
MDYVKPIESTKNMIEAAAAKAALRVSDFLIRGFLSGAILGFATSLAYTATKQTSIPLVGALVFPVGFILIILLGLELVTGNFAIMPVGMQAGRVTGGLLLANLGWVFLGNLLGSLFFGQGSNIP